MHERSTSHPSRLLIVDDERVIREVLSERLTDLGHACVPVENAFAALQRIADGEYGYCASCGEPIRAARLELDPAAAACINCARTRT